MSRPLSVYQHNGIPGHSSFDVEGEGMPQGVITLNITVNPDEFTTRMRNADRNSEFSYPGGGDKDNLVIADGEPVMHWRRPVAAGYQYGGAAEREGWTSLNGINHGPYSSKEQLEDMLGFFGFSKINNDRLSADEPQNGVSVVTFGTFTAKYNSNKPGFPGDRLVWTVPELHTSGRDYLPAQHSGKPRGKLLAIVEPLDWRELEFETDKTYVTMMSPDESAGGVAKTGLEKLRDPHGLTRKQISALATKENTIYTILRGVEALQEREIVTINTPERIDRQHILEEFMTEVLKLFVPVSSDAQTLEATFSNTAAGRASVQRGLPGESLPEKLENLVSSLIDIYNNAKNKTLNVEPTDVAQSRPTNTRYFEDDETTGRKTEGPQFNESHAYFKLGFNFRRPTQTQGLNATMSLRERREERARSQLWLARLLNGVGSIEQSESNVITDVLNTVYVKHATQDTRLAYFSDLCNVQQPLSSKSSALRFKPQMLHREYCDHSLNFLQHYHFATAEQRWSIMRRMVGWLTSNATPGKDQQIDLIASGSPGG